MQGSLSRVPLIAPHNLLRNYHQGCRERETPLAKLGQCAHCEGTQDLHTVEMIATEKDPTNPDHCMMTEPAAGFRTLRLCQKCANSAGLYAKHSNDRLHEFMPMEDLWPLIGPTTVERSKKNFSKYNT